MEAPRSSRWQATNSTAVSTDISFRLRRKESRRRRVALVATEPGRVAWNASLEVAYLWSTAWGVGVPRSDQHHQIGEYAEHGWITNSRNSADEDALRTLASLAGFTPQITHRIDSLELVEELIGAGRGVALLPDDGTPHDAVAVLPLHNPGLNLRAYALTRQGRDQWSPLRAILAHLAA